MRCQLFFLFVSLLCSGVVFSGEPLKQKAVLSMNAPGFSMNERAERQRRDVYLEQKFHRLDEEYALLTSDPTAEKNQITGLVLESERFYTRFAYGDTYFVMAKVRNSGSSTTCFNKIYMDFKSSSGYVLMSDWTYITGSNLTLTSIDSETDTCMVPGETGFFGEYVSGPMDQVSTVAYRFDVDYTGTKTPDANVIVSSGPYHTDSYGEIKLTGRLKNSGNSDANFVKVHACLEASNGRLLDVDMTYVDGVTIGGTDTGLHPNQSGPFTMYTNADSSLYYRTDTKTAWDDYGTPISCSYSISPTSKGFGPSGGTSSIGVSANSGCNWTATESLSWVRIVSGSSGSGNGTVQYEVAPNDTGTSRSGTILVAEQSFSVSQSANPSCVYLISPTSKGFDSESHTGAVSVSTSAGCTWTASSISTWITIISGSSGTGSGSVEYRISENESSTMRQGTLLIAGEVFTVFQEGVNGGQVLPQKVAGIAHIQGSGGSVWRSALAITNISGFSAELTLIYRFSSGSSVRRVTLGPGEIIEWEDVVVSLFNVAGSSAGSIEIQSNIDVFVTSRTYNEGSDGTFGQFLPGVKEGGEDLESNQQGVLPQIKKTSSFRTNIGFVNLKDSPVTVRTTLFSKEGEVLGEPVITNLEQDQWIQENDIFARAGVSNCPVGYATVELLTSGSSIWAYGSVVDNNTGDPTTIPILVQE